jgi:hypothetical protein
MPLSNSTVIFLPDVSDIWRWPNPVKTRKQTKLQLLNIKNLQHKTSFLTCI